MSNNDAMKKWAMQIYRRVQKWWLVDPEFQHYMPEHQKQYRFPAPLYVIICNIIFLHTSSQPRAETPRKEFIREFNIKYYDRDFRSAASKNNVEALYRQQVVENPTRLQKGETVGPFYGYGMEKRKIVVTHELESKQVYTYARNYYPQRPGDAEQEQLELAALEQRTAYKALPQQAAAATVCHLRFTNTMHSLGTKGTCLCHGSKIVIQQH